MRHIAPFLLLASYLPMVVASSLHVHHDTIDAHDDCQQCVGHIETAHHHDLDCLYCTFLSLNYLAQDEGQTVAITPVMERLATPTQAMATQFHHGASLLRAPPTA